MYLVLTDHGLPLYGLCDSLVICWQIDSEVILDDAKKLCRDKKCFMSGIPRTINLDEEIQFN